MPSGGGHGERMALVAGPEPTPPASDNDNDRVHVGIDGAPPESDRVSHLLAEAVTSPPTFLDVYFYHESTLRWLLGVVLCVATGGLLPILCLWRPQLWTILTRTHVTSAPEGTVALVKYSGTSESKTPRMHWEVCILHHHQANAFMDDHTLVPPLIWFEFHKIRHAWHPETQRVVAIQSELRESLATITTRAVHESGLSEASVRDRQALYGRNEIDLAPPRWLHVLLRRVVHPFYLFQVASALIWFSESYTTYALVVLLLSLLSVLWEVQTQVNNARKLYELVRMEATATVVRDQRRQVVAAHELVVGDIVVLQEGVVAADMALITGDCSADESTLTGEAIPVVKQALRPPSSQSQPQPVEPRALRANVSTRGSVLSAGSSVVSCALEARAVVVATGFATAKGELFRAIAYPVPVALRIQQDSYRFLYALSALALLAFIKRMVQATSSSPSSSSSSVSTMDAIVSALDLVTIAVPPALPLVLTVGVGFALTRLQREGILCINSQRINVAGHVDCVCFDKTGTLSSDHLDFQGVDECSSAATGVGTATGRGCQFVGLQHEVEVLSVNAIVGLATCHALQGDHDGRVTGYALEKDMFLATGFSLEATACGGGGGAVAVTRTSTRLATPPPTLPFATLISSPLGKAFGIVHRYPFDATLQRSSVLVEDIESGLHVVYTKGSPEAMRAVCDPRSLPANYHARMRTYASQGYYVLALASKTFSLPSLGGNGLDQGQGQVAGEGEGLTAVPEREEVEQGLSLVGFVLFLNKIKSEAPFVVGTLEDQHVDVRMITGDNAFTAVHVARKIKMELPRAGMLLLDAATGEQMDSKRLQQQRGSTSTANYKKKMKNGGSGIVFADLDDVVSATMTPDWTLVHDDEDASVATLLQLAESHEYALTGPALDEMQRLLLPTTVARVVLHARVFAGMKPAQKTWVVETLITQGRLCVGMVGDGTNDCGALKAAHVGLALSSADASVVSPFTSKGERLADVLTLLREGRGALSTAFVAFKYMVLYSVAQLALASLLNDHASQMSNDQFLFDDLVLVFALSVLMVRTLPAAAEDSERALGVGRRTTATAGVASSSSPSVSASSSAGVVLSSSSSSPPFSPSAPPKTLFAPPVLASLGGQIALFLLFLSAALSMATKASWFCSAEHSRDLTRAASALPIAPPCYEFIPGEPADLTQHSYENSVLWLFGHLEYWLAALVFNLRDQHRQPFYSNRLFTLYLGILAIVLMVQLFSYENERILAHGVTTTMGVLALPTAFCSSLLGLFLAQLVLSLAWEFLVVGMLVPRLQLMAASGGRHGLAPSWWRFGRAHNVVDHASLLGSAGDDARGGLRGAQKGGVREQEDSDEEMEVLTRTPEMMYVA